MAGHLTEHYEFGPFRLESSGRSLSRAGILVRMASKDLEVLLALVQARGEIVTKDELVKQVWPDSFVEEGNLARHISTLRRALASGSGGGLYIETIPKRGYRFVAPVRSVGQPVETSPTTRYTHSAGVNIAYQVLGDGPLDLVYIPGWVSHLEYGWENPLLARFYRRLASFSRLILFDKRGTGLSDQTAKPPTLEERMDDVRAVMDAVGSERAVLFGASEGGHMSLLFAATFPERTLGLITFGIFAKRLWDREYPWAPKPDARRAWLDSITALWGSPINISTLFPSLQNDEWFRQWWAAYLRRSASPGAARALAEWNTHVDVRHILPAIRVPTVILHRSGDRDVHPEEGLYIASRIPGARHVELAGQDHVPWAGDQDALLAEVETFVRGLTTGREPEHVLSTVVCLNYADLTNPDHDLVRSQLARFRGNEIQCGADRLLAAFDGPARAIRAAWNTVHNLREVASCASAGLHTGECSFQHGRTSGLPIEIGCEVAKRAGAGEVLVSSTVKDLVPGSNIFFDDRGVCWFDKLGGELRLFRVRHVT